MKEGYLQGKITELFEKTREIEQIHKIQQEELNRFMEQVGGFKQLLKRLKDIESFKESSLKTIKEENADLIRNEIDKATKRIEKSVKDDIEHRSFVLNELKKKLENDQQVFLRYADQLESLDEMLHFLIEYHRLLSLKLINKGVLSTKEKEEIERRAKKQKDEKK
ncbi:MAG: hypothetical protein QCI00_01440 [Candidatus Thermoplasmatota archaeon]|nr:hypothetical protein [Candidatus Thermoplasmatota archaeon]